MKGKGKRIFSSATAIITVIAILMTGALAWYAGSSAINAFSGTRKDNPPITTYPGANLHDDFGDPSVGGRINKRVYVENTGDTEVFVRVQLSEKLNDGNYELHIPKGSDVASCGDDFHSAFEAGSDIFKWEMGNTAPYDYTSIKDSSAWEVAEAPGNQSELIADALGHASIDAGAKADLSAGAKDKKTLTAQVITMAAYNGKNAEEKADFVGWVYDIDGYAYWSQPLAPAAATGLLLRTVTVPAKDTQTYTYDIKVDMEYVDIADIGAWLEVGSDGKRTIAVNADNQMTSSNNDEGAIIKEGPQAGGTTIEASDAAKELLKNIAARAFSFAVESITLNKGDTTEAPVAKDEEGNEVTIDTWDNKDDTVATVDPDTGDIVAIEVGETIVTGNIGDESADYKIIVTDKLQVGEEGTDNDGKVSVKVDETKTIPTIKNAKGNPVAPSSLTWTELDEAIATFNEATGEVTGVSVGTTTMIGTDANGNKATVAITVTEKDRIDRPFNFDIAIDGGLILNIGEEANAPTATRVGGGPVTIVSWVNEHQDIAEVNQTTGYVVAKAVGTTTVTGTDDDDNSDNYNIRVIDELMVGEPTDEDDDDYDELGLYGGKVTVEVDKSAPIPTIKNTKGQVISPSTLTWSGLDTDIATFNRNTGNVVGMSAGETTMVGEDANGNKATVLIKVVADPVERVLRVINPPTEINVGYPLNAPTIVDQDNRLATIVKWESNATSYLTVNQFTGVLTGVDARAAVVTITATDNHGKTASFPVKVIKELQLPIGASRDIQVVRDDSVVVVLLMEAQGKTITMTELDWAMTNTTIATFDEATSRIIGKKAGETTLVGTDDFGNTITFNIEVLEKDALILGAVNPPTNLNQGGEANAPRVEDEDGNRVTIKEWESGDPSILTVDPDTGKITGKTPGTTNVFGKDEDGNEVKFPITVTDVLTATPASVEIKKGGDANIPVIRDIHRNIVDPKDDIETWVSSDPTKATIDPDTGKINALEVGSTVLTGTDEHGNKVVINVTVLAKDPVPLVPIAPPTDMNRGDEAEEVKAGKASDPRDTVAIVEWESSNPEVVEVDAAGNLTAKQPGTTVITGTDNDGNTIDFPITVTDVFTADDIAVAAGTTKPLPVIKDVNGETVDYTDIVQWTNSDPTKATLNETTGIVSGLTKGETTLTGVDTHGNTVVIEVEVTGMTDQEKLNDAIEEELFTTRIYNPREGQGEWGDKEEMVIADNQDWVIIPYYALDPQNGSQQYGTLERNYGEIPLANFLNTDSEFWKDVTFTSTSDIVKRIDTDNEAGHIYTWYLPEYMEWTMAYLEGAYWPGTYEHSDGLRPESEVTAHLGDATFTFTIRNQYQGTILIKQELLVRP